VDERLVRRIASTPFSICTRLYFGAFCCSCSLPTFIMDERTLDIAATIVDPAYIRQGAQSLATRSAYFRKLVSQRRAPDDGWPEHVIEALLRDLAQMDSNNFDGSVGFGEREARIASPLVRRVPATAIVCRTASFVDVPRSYVCGIAGPAAPLSVGTRYWAQR